MADKLVAKTQLNYFKTKLDEEFVAKESGKVLSTNDFTNEYKTKLDSIEEGANKTVVDSTLNKESTNPVQNKVIKAEIDKIVTVGGEPNKIDTIKVNGSVQTITDKAVDIKVPTKVSELSNDSSFQTNAQVQSAISSAIGGITSFNYSVVDSLPQTGVKGTIYLVANSGSGQNVYDEYIYVDSKFEKLGPREISLSNYYDMTNYPLATEEDIDDIFTA